MTFHRNLAKGDKPKFKGQKVYKVPATWAARYMRVIAVGEYRIVPSINNAC
jgi:hypothetical protein